MSQPDGVSRRGMLAKIGIVLNAVAGAILAVPIVRYLLSPAIRVGTSGDESWLSLGAVDQFPVGETRLATYRNPITSSIGRRDREYSLLGASRGWRKFQVFAINCAHLGCPVRWFPQSGLFMCPCHGGVYYQDGSRASGPPERGLFEYPYKVEQGMLSIKAGRLPTPGSPTASLIEHIPYKNTVRLTLKKIGEWLDARVQLAAPVKETMEHRVPRETASWFYVFGSAALTVFGLQVVTGILLALIYVPSGGEAWNSLQVLNHQVSLGWFIRGPARLGIEFHGRHRSDPHGAGVPLRRLQIPPRTDLDHRHSASALDAGYGVPGQVLRFDQDAYWGLGIGASISSRVPILGPWIVNLLLGGPIIAGSTLSRFFALHVFVIPGLLIAFVGLHLLLVLKLGINEWPMPGRIVRRSTYLKEYHELTQRDGVPFVPGAMGKDLVFSAFILLAIAACAVFFGPFGPSGQPDPPLFRPCPAPIIFSCGSMPCYRCFPRRSKPPRC